MSKNPLAGPFKKGGDPRNRRLSEETRKRLDSLPKKGSPTRSYKTHVDELKALGYVIPDRESYRDMVGMLLVLEEEHLRNFADNTLKPVWIRFIAIDLLNPKKRTQIMDTHRDWLFGKAAVTQNVTVRAEKNIFEAIDLDVQDAEEVEDEQLPAASPQLEAPQPTQEAHGLTPNPEKLYDILNPPEEALTPRLREETERKDEIEAAKLKNLVKARKKMSEKRKKQKEAEKKKLREKKEALEKKEQEMFQREMEGMAAKAANAARAAKAAAPKPEEEVEEFLSDIFGE